MSSITEEKEIRLKVKSIIGAQTPFWQGGSFRMIMPKWFVRKYSQKGFKKSINKSTGLDQIPFVFIETDKGVLIRPIKELLSDEALRSKLGFSRITSMNEKDIAELINRRANEE